MALTLQEIFTKVVTHLRTQNRRASTTSAAQGGCYYRLDGLKCAAGCLIEDDEYDPEMEGKYFSRVLREFPIAAIDKNDDHAIGLVQRLQELHDNNEPADWEGEFKVIARNHHLELPRP